MSTREAGLKELNRLYAEDHRFADLRQKGTRLVPGDGPIRADLMLVGEAPGRSENTRGIPFVGRAGKLLIKIMREAGLNFHHTYRTNMVKYWPHDPDTLEKRELTEKELEGAVSFIRSEIDIVNPRIVALLGYAPLRAIFPNEGSIYKIHGELLYDKYVPLYHPAVAMYRPEKESDLVHGFKRVHEHLERVLKAPA